MEMGKLCRKIQFTSGHAGLETSIKYPRGDSKKAGALRIGAQERGVGWKRKFGNCGHRNCI